MAPKIARDHRRARGAFAVVLAICSALVACGSSSEPGTTGTRARASRPPATAERSASPAPRHASSAPTRRLTIAVSGDLLIHLPIAARASALAAGRGYDFAPMLREVRPLIRRADAAFCHVETPMTPAPPAGYPRFNTPPALARAIRWTGWDACDTASNHSLDRGQAGIDATGRALTAAGVRHTGSFSSRRARRRLLVLRVRGVRVAYLAYTTTTNGLPLPHPWSLNVASPRRILRDARRARSAGAQVVLVNLHWGTEYRHQPDPAQRDLARRLLRSGLITAIVGQHVHVVQPIRRVARRWVVFGEGNLLSNQTAACCTAASQDGVLVFLHIAVAGHTSRVTRIDYVPTWVRHPDYTVLPVGRALRRREDDPAALRASWRRTVGVVGRSGTVRPLPARLPR